MLPEFVKKLPVSQTITETSYELAREEIFDISGYRETAKVTLHTSFFDANEALYIMAKYKNCDLSITMDLAADEWYISWGNPRHPNGKAVGSDYS